MGLKGEQMGHGGEGRERERERVTGGFCRCYIVGKKFVGFDLSHIIHV